ncbi:MAG: rhomboid family intramembrane serine protease [Armatimonadota bacterium]
MSVSLEKAGSSRACPGCGKPLSEERSAQGIFWHCPACGGRLAALAVLRKTVLQQAVNEVWQEARQGVGATGKSCPECRRPMREVRTKTTDGTLMNVDVCPSCTLVWFDPREYDAMPPKPEEPKPQEEELPAEAKEALAIAKVEAIRDRYRHLREPHSGMPESSWQTVLGVMGLPVETDAPEMRDVPWVTWVIIAVVIAVSGMALFSHPQLIDDYSLIPAQAFRYGGFTFISAFFLHGGIAHLLGNMYFLLVFGDNVEDYLGKGRFLLLLLLATVAGSLAHIAADPASTVPCVGASGGISGVIAFYALAYPNARFSLFIRFAFISLPAWGFVLLWIGLQFLGAWQQINGFTNVSALAHLGGAFLGFIWWLVWRNWHREQTT